MNAIRATRALNQRELDNAVPPSASWHADYRDTAYIYIGGLQLDLSEGDIVTIFSQFGNPTHLNLVREKETGRSRGFAFLKYEDQRSCDLAVDNLGGAEVLGRVLRVDHSRYKKKEGEDEDTWRIERLEKGDDTEGGGSSDVEQEEGRRRKRRKVLKEERELEVLLLEDRKRDGVDEDPMREYLIREKREEVEKAKEREREKKQRRKHRHHHRDREGSEDAHVSRKHKREERDKEDGDGDRSSRTYRHRDGSVGDNDDEKYRRSRRDHERDDNSRDGRKHRERDSRVYRDDPDRGYRRPRSRQRSSSPDSRDRRRRSRDRK